jgi:hypothetical protein
MINGRDDWLSPAGFVAGIGEPVSISDVVSGPVFEVSDVPDAIKAGGYGDAYRAGERAKAARDLAKTTAELLENSIAVGWPNPSDVCARVGAAFQSGSSLIVMDPLLADLNMGAIFTIDGVFAWNRSECEPTSWLRKFIVTAKAEIGHRVIHLYPPIVGEADPAHRTVAALPMGRVCVRIGSYPSA